MVGQRTVPCPTKIFKGAAAFGSTLLCGAIGGVATSGIGNGVGSCLEKAVVSGVYGVAASGFDYVIQ
ncbi:MAG: hypothetical protein K6G17_06905, partial [Oscillospiraceae bacterium]|nr:hypothetical protein [Oscillospiraceae bacterium]